MTKKTILTIESFDDPTARSMLHSIYSSDEYNDFKIDHCFFLKRGQSAGNTATIFQLIRDKIVECKPDVILIHSGASFLTHKNIFINLIPKLRELFPNILWGIQRRIVIKADILEILDDNQEIIKLEKIIFLINR